MRKRREWKGRISVKNVYIAYCGVHEFLLSLSNEVCRECLSFVGDFDGGGRSKIHEENEIESFLLH